MTQHRVDPAGLRFRLRELAASEADHIVALEAAKGNTVQPATREALERTLLDQHEAQLAQHLAVHH